LQAHLPFVLCVQKQIKTDKEVKEKNKEEVLCVYTSNPHGTGTTATLLARTGRAGGGAVQVGAYFDGDGAGAKKLGSKSMETGQGRRSLALFGL
jgi:hypothetical protein